jgi:hypothetical protein
VVRDGAEVLDYVFCSGAYATRKKDDGPKVILLAPPDLYGAPSSGLDDSASRTPFFYEIGE